MSIPSPTIPTDQPLPHAPAREANGVLSLAGRYTSQALLYLILPAFGLIFIMPLVWLVSSSLKTESQAAALPPNFIPNPVMLVNYPTALDLFPFWTSAANTMVILVGVMVGHLLTASFTAYAFARIRFPGRDAIFVLVLSTMMIPYYAYLLPQYLLFRDLHWLDSPLPLIVPSLFGQAPFFIFLFRQFFRTIPREYDEAARIDGCGWLDIYWRIMLPLILPALGATAIFSFMGTWNDFLAPLIYLNEPSKQTLAIAIRTWEAFQSHGTIAHALRVHILAVSVLITIPPILLFFFAQRYFIQGVVVSGVKG
jgi:multiple sugar transport system permease protein